MSRCTEDSQHLASPPPRRTPSLGGLNLSIFVDGTIPHHRINTLHTPRARGWTTTCHPESSPSVRRNEQPRDFPVLRGMCLAWCAMLFRVYCALPCAVRLCLHACRDVCYCMSVVACQRLIVSLYVYRCMPTAASSVVCLSLRLPLYVCRCMPALCLPLYVCRCMPAAASALYALYVCHVTCLQLHLHCMHCMHCMSVIACLQLRLPLYVCRCMPAAAFAAVCLSLHACSFVCRCMPAAAFAAVCLSCCMPAASSATVCLPCCMPAAVSAYVCHIACLQLRLSFYVRHCTPADTVV